jgi:hypothetical protein
MWVVVERMLQWDVAAKFRLAEYMVQMMLLSEQLMGKL